MGENGTANRIMATLGSAFLGALCGALLVAFASVISGSVSGAVLTIVVGAILAGWLRWRTTSADADHAPEPGEESYP